MTTYDFKDDFGCGEYSVQGSRASIGIDTAKPPIPVSAPKQLKIIDSPGIGFGFMGYACEFPVQTLKIDHSLYFKESGKINFDMKQKGADDFARVTIDVQISAGRDAIVDDLPKYFSTKDLIRALFLSVIKHVWRGS